MKPVSMVVKKLCLLIAMTFPAEPRHSTTSPTSPGIPEARLATTVLQRLRLAELLCSSADGSMANQHVFQQPHSHRWIIRGMYMILYIYDHTDISNITLLDHDFATIWCIWSPFWRSTPVTRDLVLWNAFSLLLKNFKQIKKAKTNPKKSKTQSKPQLEKSENQSKKKANSNPNLN